MLIKLQYYLFVYMYFKVMSRPDELRTWQAVISH